MSLLQDNCCATLEQIFNSQNEATEKLRETVCDEVRLTKNELAILKNELSNVSESLSRKIKAELRD